MTPDTEELIKRVNALTLDKNRLKQKLTQLSLAGSSNQTKGSKEALNSSPPSSSPTENVVQSPSSLTAQNDLNGSPNNSLPHAKLQNSINQSQRIATDSIKLINNNIIAGVECSTSCEADLLYINDLYRKRLDEYELFSEFIQSKCTALLSELNALQNRYRLLMKEKEDTEEKLRSKCDDYDNVKSDLQTTVLNYETQLSAMSEHLSMITNQVSLEDKLSSH